MKGLILLIEKEKVNKVNNKPEIPFNPKKIETSKIVLAIVLFICFCFAVVVLYGWLQGLTDAPMLMTAVLSPTVAVISWYSYKSKKENEIKLKYLYGEQYIADFEMIKYQNQNLYGGYSNYGNYNPYYTQQSCETNSIDNNAMG